MYNNIVCPSGINQHRLSEKPLLQCLYKCDEQHAVRVNHDFTGKLKPDFIFIFANFTFTLLNFHVFISFVGCD